MLDFAVPFQSRVRGYIDDPATLDGVLAKGADRAREVASSTLATVYDRMGFLPAAGAGRS